MPQSPRGHDGFDPGSCSESHLLPLDADAGGRPPVLLRPLLGSVLALLLHGSLLLSSLFFFFLAGLTRAVMRGPPASAGSCGPVLPTARTAAGAAPRLPTRGRWPQAAPLFPRARRQRPSVSGSRPRRVGSGGLRAGFELSPSATKPTPRDTSNLPSSPTSMATAAWAIVTSVLTGSPHVGTAPLCHSSSHMTSSLRNLRWLPRPPRWSQPGPGPEGPALSSGPRPPGTPHCGGFQAGVSRHARGRTEGTLRTY